MKNKKVILLILTISLVAIIACSKCYESNGCSSGSEFSTGERTIISNGVSRVYYLKLPEDYDANTPYPLVFGFHGTGGDYTNFVEDQYYDLEGVIGEEAILVYPNALLNANDVAQWDYDTDIPFFDVLFQELEENLCFDVRKVFATGHSSGAGMSHTLGCKRGNIFRAIGPVAGGLADNKDRIGQVAVIQVHGKADTIVPLALGEATRNYWAGINSCSNEESKVSVGVDPSCDAYGDCDTKFPVQYCEHSGGHEWPDFASNAIWNFFKSLPLAAPSKKTGTGLPWYVEPGTISFKIRFPSDFVGIPEKLAISMYPPDTTQPLMTHPLHILNNDVTIEDYQIGAVSEFNNIDINMYGVEYGDYTLSVVIYVKGGNYPIPTTGQDYVALQNITIDSNTIIVETPLEPEFVESF